jgi:hypothetical protein
LATFSELTPRKCKSYESTLCKLKKKYNAKKLEKFCDVDRDPSMDNLLSFFSVEAARFLEANFRKSRQRPKGSKWDFEDNVLALSPHNVVQNAISFSEHYSLSQPDDPCNLS